jgi:hypothetical protein
MRKLVMMLCCISLLTALTGCCGAFQQDKGGRVPIVETLDAVRAANAVSAPVNPWAVPIEGVLGTISLAIATYAATLKRKNSVVAKKYEAHKRGVESVMRESDADSAEVIYRKIAEERKKLNI